MLHCVTTLMSYSLSSSEFIALHSNLGHVTDHWGISLNRSNLMFYKNFSEPVKLKFGHFGL